MRTIRRESVTNDMKKEIVNNEKKIKKNEELIKAETTGNNNVNHDTKKSRSKKGVVN